MKCGIFAPVVFEFLENRCGQIRFDENRAVGSEPQSKTELWVPSPILQNGRGEMKPFLKVGVRIPHTTNTVPSLSPH
jgi:hypothetical protein